MHPRKSVHIATLLLVLFAAHSLFASISHTTVNKVIPNNTNYPIDLDHGGAADFWIKQTYGLQYCGLRSYPAGAVSLSPARATSEVILDGGFAAALPAGVTVGPTRTFAPGKTNLMSFSLCGGPRYAGNWFQVSNQYLGVQFSIAGQIHYGWIELSVAVNRAALTTVVVGFAYETVAGKAITTGQTGVPSTCAWPSTDQTVHICTPAAGSTVGSPVTISARARWDGHTIHHMRVYVDNVARFDVDLPAGGALNTTLSLTAGSHHLVVTAWDTAGQSIRGGETFSSQ